MHIWFSVIFCLMVSAGYIEAVNDMTPVTGNLAENSAVGTSVELTGADGTPPYTFTVGTQDPDLDWFEVSGTGATGTIAIAADQVVDYEHASLPGTKLYKVQVVIADDADTVVTTTVTFTYTITDVNDAPAFAASAFAVQMASPQDADTALVTCGATDVDGDTLTYTIDDDVNFDISSTTGAVTVKTGVTLTNTFITTKVNAADDATTPLTDTAYLFVCIGTTCSSGATTITGSVLAAISVLIALLMKVA